VGRRLKYSGELGGCCCPQSSSATLTPPPFGRARAVRLASLHLKGALAPELALRAARPVASATSQPGLGPGPEGGHLAAMVAAACCALGGSRLPRGASGTRAADGSQPLRGHHPQKQNPRSRQEGRRLQQALLPCPVWLTHFVCQLVLRFTGGKLGLFSRWQHCCG